MVDGSEEQRGVIRFADHIQIFGDDFFIAAINNIFLDFNNLFVYIVADIR